MPTASSGTFFKNGHAKFEVGEDKILHPFEGDGMVSAVTIADGKAFFRNKFVRTEGFKREQKKGRVLYRGTFATPKSGGILANIFNTESKNLANTHVLYWANKFFALYEAGKPYKVDPASLSTFGESTLGGALKKQDWFAAHYKIDPKSKTLLNFSSKAQGLDGSTITTYEFDEEFKLLQRRDISIPGWSFIHDMGITENHFVLMQPPMTFDVVPFLLGQKCAVECSEFQPTQPSMFHVIPRDGKREPVSIPAPGHFVFHVGNAFEEPDTGYIVFDQVESSESLLSIDNIDKTKPLWETTDFAKLARNTFKRYKLDPKTGRVVGSTTLYDRCSEFPVVNPEFVGRPYRYVWSSIPPTTKTNGALQGLLKMDLETSERWTWFPEEYEFLSEACYAPRKLADGSFSKEEDDGFIVTYLLNGRDMKSEFVVFDAKEIQKGPISRVPLQDFIPHGLHGTFVPGLAFDLDKAKRASKLFTMAEKNKWNEVKSDFSGLGANFLFE
uniref:Carotenoid oxygenase n=1 Tax=Pinguiococcus pyrenoidosus TaxID=172671 RepID=A0A7R9UG98_9STRA|mmetsp:Transcript_9750/g.36660  ORF Transcript_9750/g.36660 Transcript_9750/m.36660 type:complete len:499 (+) Transcript_9750:510-2006(+)